VIALLLLLLSLFIVVPLVELALLLKLADLTDWQFTLVLVVVTGLVGTLLARAQGLRTYQRIRQELSAGRLPSDSLLDAVMILLASGLLLTPGILTDLFGLSLLIPIFRRYYRQQIARWFRNRFTVHAFTDSSSPPDRSQVVDSYVVRGTSGENQLPAPDDGADPPHESGFN